MRNVSFNDGLISVIIVFLIVISFDASQLQADTLPQIYENALNQVNGDTHDFPYTYQGRLQLGNRLSQDDFYDSANKIYNQLLNDFPESQDVLLFRGRNYGWEGSLKQSEKDLRKVLRMNPDYSGAWQLLGNVYRWSNRPDSAVHAYSKWIDLKPDQPEPYLHRGKVYRTRGQYELAEKDFSKAANKGADPDEIPKLRPKAPIITNDNYEWHARAGYRRTNLSLGRSSWTRYNVSLQKDFDPGTVKLEVFQAKHFNTWNTGILLDTYWDLSSGRYINLRYQTSPQGDFLAKSDIMAEIYQPFGHVWEGSLGFRTMNFNGNQVNIRKVGLARYWGSWYGRWVIRDIANNTSSGIFHTLNLRRYLDGSDEFVGIRGGIGEGVVEVSRSNPAGTIDTLTLGARYQFYFNEKNGFDLSVGYVGPDGQALRRSVTIEYLHRW